MLFGKIRAENLANLYPGLGSEPRKFILDPSWTKGGQHHETIIKMSQMSKDGKATSYGL